MYLCVNMCAWLRRFGVSYEMFLRHFLFLFALLEITFAEKKIEIQLIITICRRIVSHLTLIHNSFLTNNKTESKLQLS